jgi:chaperonin GroEL (HSP60 family)
LVDIFKTFSAIKNNKQFDRFSKAVDTFSKSCSDLIDSLDNFSKSSSTSETGEESTTETTNVNGGVSITNSQDIANAIAAAIKNLPINVQTDISDVRLVVNNETGRRVILTLDN